MKAQNVRHFQNRFDILILTGGINMDWVTGIQNAINYIEDNITEDLDYAP